MNIKLVVLGLLAVSAALLISACGAAQFSSPGAPTSAPVYVYGSVGMGMAPALASRASVGNGHMGGMMGDGQMGGMMSGYVQYAPTAEPTPAGATPAPVDQVVAITASNLRFSSDQIIVQPGATVRFTITNSDSVVHNFVSQEAGIPFLSLPANTTQTLTWTAPKIEGSYVALCTLHPGMTVVIEVKK
jgi:plastocyanin